MTVRRLKLARPKVILGKKARSPNADKLLGMSSWSKEGKEELLTPEKVIEDSGTTQLRNIGG